MNSFDRRISRLLLAAEQATKESRRRDPYVELRIFSITEDVAAVIYRPEGAYGTESRTDGLTICAALEKAAAYKAPIYSDMVFCCEWAHVFYMRSEDYTEAQKASFKAEDMAIHGVRKLYDLADVENVIDVLVGLPQFIRLDDVGN